MTKTWGHVCLGFSFMMFESAQALRSKLSGEAHPPGRSVRPRRSDRHVFPRNGRRDEQKPWPASDRRKPPRRGHHDRGRIRRQISAGRLHAAIHRSLDAHDHAVDLPETAVSPAAGFRRGRAGVFVADDHGRASFGQREVGKGADCAGEKTSGNYLRQRRRGHGHPHGGGEIPAGGRASISRRSTTRAGPLPRSPC